MLFCVLAGLLPGLVFQVPLRSNLTTVMTPLLLLFLQRLFALLPRSWLGLSLVRPLVLGRAVCCFGFRSSHKFQHGFGVAQLLVCKDLARPCFLCFVPGSFHHQPPG